MVCCPNCFAHQFIKDFILENSQATDQCDFCAAEDCPVVNVSELADYFHNLLEIYQPLLRGENIADFEDPLVVGERLIDLVQWDWDVFSDKLNENATERLLEEIVNSDWDNDNGEPRVDASELYTGRLSIWHESQAEMWEEFREKVRRDEEIAPHFVDELFPENLYRTAATLKAGTEFFRARKGWSETRPDDTKEAFAGTDIGAPPAGTAKPGRANRGGQSVLYLADQEKTAIAEVRPARGLLVSVCKVKTQLDLQIVDLSAPITYPNPFTTAALRYEMEVVDLLNAFAWELSNPLQREDDPTDYVPCQKLCESIQQANFDGIRYPSALNPAGTNVVFFNPSVAEILDSKLVEVIETNVDYRNAN